MAHDGPHAVALGRGRRAPDNELEGRGHVVPLPITQRPQHLGDLLVGGRRLSEQLGDRCRSQLNSRDQLSGGPHSSRSTSLAHREELRALRERHRRVISYRGCVHNCT